jgi:hypothetical protein
MTGGVPNSTGMEVPGGGSGAFVSPHVENPVDEASLSNKRAPWLHGPPLAIVISYPAGRPTRPRDHRSRLVDVAIVPMIKII